MPVDPRTPVLIGHGQVNHRDEIDPDKPSIEPVDLMVAAARQAGDPHVLEAVDSVRVVNILSAHYRDPGLLVGQRIGATEFSTLYSPVGGNVPQSLVNQACLDIQAGRAGLVLVTGAETWRTRRGLRAKGGKLQWTVQDDSVPMAEVAGDDVAMAGDAEIRIGLDRPAYVYPLFEQALQRRRRRQPECVDSRTGDRRGDHAPRSTQPDDQLAVHQADELQQHGRPGRCPALDVS
jgi:acetyl-CoA C-acetyltransferase